MLKILMKCCITRVVVGDHRQLVLVTEIRGALPVAGMVLTGLLVEGGLQVVAVIHLEGPGFWDGRRHNVVVGDGNDGEVVKNHDH